MNKSASKNFLNPFVFSQMNTLKVKPCVIACLALATEIAAKLHKPAFYSFSVL